MKKPRLAEARTDLEAVSVAGGTSQLTEEILRERRDRLRKQNVKLDYEIQRQEQQYGDLSEMRREVLRANETVKQSLHSMCVRISEQLGTMSDPGEIQRFLREELNVTLTNLAYEHTRQEPPDD